MALDALNLKIPRSVCKRVGCRYCDVCVCLCASSRSEISLSFIRTYRLIVRWLKTIRHPLYISPAAECVSRQRRQRGCCFHCLPHHLNIPIYYVIRIGLYILNGCCRHCTRMNGKKSRRRTTRGRNQLQRNANGNDRTKSLLHPCDFYSCVQSRIWNVLVVPLAQRMKDNRRQETEQKKERSRTMNAMGFRKLFQLW